MPNACRAHTASDRHIGERLPSPSALQLQRAGPVVFGLGLFQPVLVLLESLLGRECPPGLARPRLMIYVATQLSQRGEKGYKMGWGS